MSGPRTRRLRPVTPSLVAALALVTSACGGGAEAPTSSAEDAGDGEAAELAVAVASYDLAVGDDQRLLTGLFTQDRQLLGFGEVTFRLGHLGDEPAGQAELSEPVTATYLPVPGMEPEGDSDVPILLADATGNGVYAAEVDLDEPGYWGVQVTAQLDDGTVMTGSTSFLVHEEPLAPAIGDDAPRTVNHTAADAEAGTVAPVAVDSRAQDGAEIPDPHLHRAVIAESIEQARPVVVIVSTPVYCVSRFCGPLVETLADVAVEHEDRADFVHLEVWEDFDEQRTNAAAAEWIETPAGSFEPWVFLVDADGRVAARWDNVVDVDALEAQLEQLPTIEPASALGRSATP